MAKGSAELYYTSPQSLPCFKSSLLRSETEYWNGAQVSVTTSADSFWEEDPEERIKKKVLACKSVFHMGRCLNIKHLPRDVTESVSVIYIRPTLFESFDKVYQLVFFLYSRFYTNFFFLIIHFQAFGPNKTNPVLVYLLNTFVRV